jgi:hypothetical protein
MFVKVNEKEYRISFAHDSKERKSFCNIDEIKGEGESREFNTVSIGTAICGPKDNFNRIVGRKVAFTRAVSIFTKEEREAFWNIYKDSGTKFDAKVRKVVFVPQFANAY